MAYIDHAQKRALKSDVNLPVQFTPAALRHIKETLKQHAKFVVGLRLGVKVNKGCSGFAYAFDYVKPEEIKQEDDVFCTLEGIKVFIDPKWLTTFQGSTIDYVKKGLNASLECINPNEVARCGCGESFSLQNAINQI